MLENSLLDDLLIELRSIPELDVILSKAQRERFSRDFFDYSPILIELLEGCIADIVVRPHSVEAVLAVARICRTFRVYLTIRGSGTGNYGQCVPLKGGVVMLMGALDKIRNFDSDNCYLTVECGCLLGNIEKKLAFYSRELRLMPSTWKSASIGGFIAGGSGGIGSFRWGFLRDPGNLLGLEVVTLQDEPKKLQLDGSSSEALNHAYGTNGIITALKLSTAPKINWCEVIVECSDWLQSLQLMLKFSQVAIDIKLCTLLEKEIVIQLPRISDFSSGKHCLMILVSPDGVDVIERLSSSVGASFRSLGPENDGKGISLRELSWNHTTLHLRAIDSSWTYLQMLLPLGEYKVTEKLKSIWGDDLLWHLEGVRQMGNQRIAALPVIRWRDQESLELIMKQCSDLGAILFNPHVVTVEDGGLGVVDVNQVDAKRKYDPLGLLNPGKLRGWQ